jgi:hypothetical protein
MAIVKDDECSLTRRELLDQLLESGVARWGD